jgi:translation initiation factor IF-1
VEVLQSALYRVELPNGHQVMAHVSRKMRQSFGAIKVGWTVTLEMSPYDLSEGRIIGSSVREDATK